MVERHRALATRYRMWVTPRRLNHTDDPKLDMLGAQMLEQPAPAAEQDGNEVNFHFIQNPGSKRLLRNVRAVDQYVERPGRGFRVSDGALDSSGNEN